MGRHRNNRGSHQRREVAQEAARIMREEGIRDYLLAKRKAANRLCIVDRNALPGNEEIVEALSEQQRLFGGTAYADRLQALRVVAQQAMALFQEFSPRLVGPVLTGAVTDQSAVSLHVFSDTPEQVAYRLLEMNIPYDIDDVRVRYPQDNYKLLPVYSFAVTDISVEATVFSMTGLRHPPTCPIDGKPMRRLQLREVETLVEGHGEQTETQLLSESSL
ncbi:MAG: hypothetical protein ACR2QU_03380 [Gammaproteobacteria bacterium]